MPAALLHRCHHHEFREAASRCPECRRYFCRECVTEHEGRVVCADCLKRLSLKARRGSVAAKRLGRLALPLFGLILAWIIFYATGRLLLTIPVEVHDGSIWSTK